MRLSAPVPVLADARAATRPTRRAATVATLVVAVVLGGTAGVTGALLVVPDRNGTRRPSCSSSSEAVRGLRPRTSRPPRAPSCKCRPGPDRGRERIRLRHPTHPGHVLTNHHVVDGSSWVRLVLPDGTSVGGRVVGSDERSDIAVIEGLRSPGPGPCSGPAPTLRIGQQVIAVGSPLGLNGTVTSGIVSAGGPRDGGGRAAPRADRRFDQPGQLRRPAGRRRRTRRRRETARSRPSARAPGHRHRVRGADRRRRPDRCGHHPGG